jgi:hypothetical protein
VNKGMQVLSEHNDAYFNFINSLDSNRTRQSYECCIQKFLNHCNSDLESLLKLPQQDISILLIRSRRKKISKSYKNQIFSALKHACEMNDVILNWKKLKKFIKSEKTENEISGKDRGYNHQEIQDLIETKMNEIILKINEADSIIESDKLYSELRILNWILY